MEYRELYQTILGLGEPWTVERVKLKEAAQAVEIWIGEREGTRFTCPDCGAVALVFDRAERRWRHLDTCRFTMMLCARVPRVACPTHGVTTIRVLWTEPGSRFTLLFERLAIAWLKEASLSTVARRLGLTWDEAEGIQHRAVRRGLARRAAERAITSVAQIGLDEESFLKRHEYVSVVVDLDRARVLHGADDRKAASLAGYVAGLTEAERAGLAAIARDMWEPCRQRVLAHVPDADEKIVFDKFHVTAHVAAAVDAVRKREQKLLAVVGDPRLTGTKYAWLKHPAHFTRQAWREFTALREGTVQPARASALKESLRWLWDYTYVGAARTFFRRWYGWAVRSRLEPMRKVARRSRRIWRTSSPTSRTASPTPLRRGRTRRSSDQVRRLGLPQPRGVQAGDPLSLRRPGPRAARRLTPTHTKPGRAKNLLGGTRCRPQGRHLVPRVRTLTRPSASSG